MPNGGTATFTLARISLHRRGIREPGPRLGGSDANDARSTTYPKMTHFSGSSEPFVGVTWPAIPLSRRDALVVAHGRRSEPQRRVLDPLRTLPKMSGGMAYAHLGRSGLLVSRIALGTMDFGYLLDESSSFEVMDAAVDAGINHFDTADVYGGPQTADMTKGYGVSEEVIGRWLQRSGRRDEIVLATKAYQPMGLGPNDRRLSAYHLRRACEASLRRLQTDHIDLYQMHHVDRATPWEEIWQATEQLVREGKVTYLGSSNFAAWDVALAQSAANARHFLGLTSEQCLYNVAKRAVEMELVPALRSLGVGLIAYSPLHAGLLAGALQAVETAGASVDLLQPVRGQLEAYEALCREIGAKPAHVALAWLLHQPVVSTALVGARSVDQLQANLGGLALNLEPAVLERLDHIWPGPGEAPQAYAW